MINLLRNIYANDSIISEVDMGVTECTQLWNCNAVDYLKVLCTKPLCFSPVHDDYRLNDTPIEALHAPVQQIMRTYLPQKIAPYLKKLPNKPCR